MEDYLEANAKGKSFAYFLLIALFLFIAGLSYFLPYQRDDFLYAFIWNTPKRIKSFQDILKSLEIHYLTWGGRIVPVFIMQYFQLLGKGYFAVVNGLMYVSLMVLIYCHALGRWTPRFNPWILSMIIVASWFALPDYGFTSIWACGTANYLWPAVLILLTLLPYQVYLAEDEVRPQSRFIKGGCLFFLALVAGLTIENMVLTMCLALLGSNVCAYKKGRLCAWMVMGALGGVLGMVILMAAPGNFVRMDTNIMLWYDRIANFFGAHVQILLGLLPVLLLIVLLLKYLLGTESRPPLIKITGGGRNLYLQLAFIGLLSLSSVAGHLLAHGLTTGIIRYILTPLGLANEDVYSKLSYALSSTEAVLIYIIVCTMLYNLGKKVLQVQDVSLAQNLKNLFRHPAYRQDKIFWQRWLTVLGLALVHNGMMLFSPQFPARAGFGASVFVLILMAMLLMRAPVYQKVILPWQRAWVIILALAFVPMALETWVGSQTLYEENKVREAYIHEQVAVGNTELKLKKLSVETSVLRHIYFSDMDSGFARSCALPYYRLKKVEVQK